MSTLFYPIWVGEQRFAVPWNYVKEIRKVPWTGTDITALHTRYGRIELCDLAVWAHIKPLEAQRIVLMVMLNQVHVGVIVDHIDAPVAFADTLLDLPPLLHDASVDPSIIGVILIDEIPCLVLDLEALTLMHMPDYANPPE